MAPGTQHLQKWIDAKDEERTTGSPSCLHSTVICVGKKHFTHKAQEVRAVPVQFPKCPTICFRKSAESKAKKQIFPSDAWECSGKIEESHSRDAGGRRQF
eukprot:6347892-Karenia_brevis.AAC.1